MALPPIRRSMGNAFRRNSANSRQSAQAAQYTSNVNGAQTAGPQNMQQSNVFHPQQVLKQYPQQQPFAQQIQSMPSLDYSATKNFMGGPLPISSREDHGDMSGYDRVTPQIPQQVLKQFPQQGQPQQSLLNTPISQSIGNMVRRIGNYQGPEGKSFLNTPISHMVGQALGYGQPQTQPQPSAVDQPQQYEMSDEDIMDYLNEEPQQKLGIPVKLVGQQASAVNQPQPGGLQYQPQATPQGASLSLPQGRDRLMDRLSEAKQQEAEAAQRLMLSRHNGNPEYNIARGGGSPEEEAAFQGQLAQQRNQQANADSAYMPGGEQMGRFAQLQAMQSNVNPPQAEDTQANIAAYGTREGWRYADRVMNTGRVRMQDGVRVPEQALTSRGNTSRPGGPITSNTREVPGNPFDSILTAPAVDLTGQMDHKGQMISARTAPAYRDKAAANRERIDERRAARGGMSERQARDISRRMDKPSALADYAIRNGLENHPMVRSILGGKQGSAVYENTPGSGGPPSAADRDAAGVRGATAEANSAYANRAGFARTEDGVPSHQETVAAMFTNQDQPTFSDLGEWAEIHQERVTNDSNYGKHPTGKPNPTFDKMSKLAEQVIAAKNRGDEKKVMALYESIKKEEEKRIADRKYTIPSATT